MILYIKENLKDYNYTNHLILIQELFIVNIDESLPCGKLTNELPWDEFGDIFLLNKLADEPLEINDGFSDTISRLNA